MKILETERTNLREIVETDCDFILNLLNQPSFIHYIGDRNVRTIDDARDYIESRFTESYKKFGFGLWVVELKETNQPMGICGFVKRDSLPDADIGFAFLPQFEGKGYAVEAAHAAMIYGRETLKLPRILAVTSLDNESSRKLLEKIGLNYERLIVFPGSDEELRLFS